MLDFLFTFGIMFYASAPFYHAFMHMPLSFILSCCLSVFVWLFSFYLFFVFKIKKEKKSEKYKNSVCFVYIGTYVPWMTIETNFSKLCIFYSLDEHLYAQLSKWVLWLMFVMSKINLSLVLNTCITLFYGKD